MGTFGSFLVRLKQRHVYRVAVVYAAIGWLLVQVVTQVFPVFSFPVWTERLVVVVALAGFPVAVLLAWFYEFTPSGPRRDVTPGAPRRKYTFHRIDLAILALVALTIAVTVGLWHTGPLFAHHRETAATAAVSARPRSVAVLPFQNLSSDPANGYFAAGMQEQILAQLTRLSGLKVISRTSTEKYASHPEDLKQIGKELGADTILEGSVQKVGDEVRISLQLIDAASDTHLWAETYDRDSSRVFTVESEVAGRVAAALQVKLLPSEKRHLARAPTRNPDAYDALLRGEAAQQRAETNWRKFDIDAAIAAFTQAVGDDPKFALAWARLGYAYAWTLRYVADVDRPAAMKLSRDAFGRALALDPDLPEAHVAAGFYHLWGEDDHVAAREQFKEALASNPQDAQAQLALAGAEHALGHLDDAALAFRRTLSLDPRNVLALQGLAWLQGDKRQYAAADRTLVKALAIDYHAGLTWGMRDVLAYKATGDGAAQLAMIRSAPPDVVANPNAVIDQATALYRMRDYRSALKLLLDSKGSIYDESTLCVWRADAEWSIAGHRSDAKARYERCAAMLTGDPQHEADANDAAELGWIYSRLGRAPDAEREGLRAVQLIPISKSWSDGADLLYNLALIRAQLDQADKAVAILDSLLSTDHGNALSIASVRSDPNLDPIRDATAFKRLLHEYAADDTRTAQSH